MAPRCGQRRRGPSTLVESGSSDERGRWILLTTLPFLPRRSMGKAERTAHGRQRDEIGWEIAVVGRMKGGNEHSGLVQWRVDYLRIYCTIGSCGHLHPSWARQLVVSVCIVHGTAAYTICGSQWKTAVGRNKCHRTGGADGFETGNKRTALVSFDYASHMLNNGVVVSSKHGSERVKTANPEMNTIDLRQRVPFQFSDDSREREEDRIILDDQEQEELVQSLRDQETASSRLHLIALGGILALASTLQIIVFAYPSRNNPLLVIFPNDGYATDMPTPLMRLFAALSIVVYIGLALLIYSDTLGNWLQSQRLELPQLSFRSLYILSAITPVCCIFVGQSWQNVVWWSSTAAIVLLVQTVQSAAESGGQSILELEQMKYVARGA